MTSQTSKKAQNLMLPMQIELIRPGKRKIKVMANAVANIPLKQMKNAWN